MIVGTAGHIDHGKTSLIRALTGRDTDRLPEEHRRGISIELGYAFLPLEDGTTLAFVDVPGHERFVHTMLAGATGVDVALLVIAADDGPMPQTHEHLDILRLLGVSRGVIALTKVDAVDPARVCEARGEIARALEDSGQAAWPVLEVSSRTGQGVAALGARLAQMAAVAAVADKRGAGARFRLAVDRAFTLPGIGTVVTGTVHAGVVREGDEIHVAPGGTRARVRSIHAQDRPAREGRAGQRCALNLAGVGKDEVPRGAWIQGAGPSNDCERFDATLLLSPREARALASSTEVHLHHGSRDVLARIGVLDAPSAAPGARVLVSITPAVTLAACRGDRFVIRDSCAQRTMGGGVVLDIDPPVRHRRAPQRLALLGQLRDRDSTGALAARLEAGPMRIERLAGAWNLGTDERDALLTATGARLAAGWAFAPSAWHAVRQACIAAVDEIHQREPEMPGLERNRLRRMAAPKIEPDAFAIIVDELLDDGSLVGRGAFLAHPSHKAELAPTERVRWETIKPLLMQAPFGPPRVRDIASLAGIAEPEVRTLLRKVARVGDVMLVAQDHFFLSDAIARLADIAAELTQADGVARAAAFRDRIGGGRKAAIQILEFFDRVGYTRRIGDEHVLRSANPWRVREPLAA